MSIQPDPPIQLDPSQDTGHQLAFINQNFQSIANFLKSNSFKIIKTGTGTLPSFTSPATNTTMVPHGLNFIPIPLVFIGDATSIYYALPAILGYNLGTPTAGVINISSYVGYNVDDANLQIYHANSSTGTTLSYPFKYFLLQETAN